MSYCAYTSSADSADFHLYFSSFSFSFPFDEKKQKSCAFRGAFFRTSLCANSLISRTVLRRPFPFRTFHRFGKPDNAPSSYTGSLISEFLSRHFARHRLRIKGSAYFKCPPANRLNTKTCVHTVAPCPKDFGVGEDRVR